MSIFYTLAVILKITLLVAATDDTNNTTNDFKYQNNACYNYKDYPFYPISKHCFKSPYVLQDTPNLIKLNGYEYQEHEVTTTDGYIITIYRVFQNTPKGQPVYIQHGIASESSTWVQQEKDSLAFYLVRQGYDVWLGNLRVSQYGKRHVTFDSNSNNFWNFTVDDLAEFDVRNSLQKVAEVTGKKGEILYIGHSMGTTMILMYLSQYPTENLIKGVFLLSPVAYLSTTPLSKLYLGFIYVLGNVLKSLGVTSIFHNDAEVHRNFQIICKSFPYFCLGLVDASLGQSDLFLPEELTIYFSYFPDTIAVNQMIQFGQFGLSERFEKFNYGPQENMKRYNQKTPPKYNLGNIKCPVYLFYGKNDVVVKKETVQRLFNELLSTKIKEILVVPINNNNKNEQFGHIQFLIGRNVIELFYKDLYNYMAKLA